MREYLNKSSSKQLFSKISNNKSQDEMLLSGDWTDSALIEATVDIEKSGPFSGVAGWKDMQGGSGLAGGPSLPGSVLTLNTSFGSIFSYSVNVKHHLSKVFKSQML